MWFVLTIVQSIVHISFLPLLAFVILMIAGIVGMIINAVISNNVWKGRTVVKNPAEILPSIVPKSKQLKRKDIDIVLILGSITETR